VTGPLLLTLREVEGPCRRCNWTEKAIGPVTELSQPVDETDLFLPWWLRGVWCG